MIQFGMKYFGLDYYIEVRKKKESAQLRGDRVLCKHQRQTNEILMSIFSPSIRFRKEENEIR